MGFGLGCLPALLSPAAVYRTIAAVEAFVDRHYGDQLAALSGQRAFEPLAAVLGQFRAEECAHRDEAQAKGPARAGGPWAALVFQGSALGAALAKRI
jgi:demethoxyubiquinone hydroxylase (CLK1/Coq7/Cat5 family)